MTHDGQERVAQQRTEPVECGWSWIVPRRGEGNVRSSIEDVLSLNSTLCGQRIQLPAFRIRFHVVFCRHAHTDHHHPGHHVHIERVCCTRSWNG